MPKDLAGVVLVGPSNIKVKVDKIGEGVSSFHKLRSCDI